MSTLTIVQTATLPKVNLLPPEIGESRRFRRVQGCLAAVVAAFLGLVGVAFLLFSAQASSAQEDLDDSKAAHTQVQARAAEYAAVPKVYAAVKAADAQLPLAMGSEIRWSSFLNDLSLRTPDMVGLTAMTVTTTDPSAAPPAPGAGGAAPLALGLGTIQFVGQAASHDQVAAWLDSLAEQKGYDQPFLNTSTKGGTAGDASGSSAATSAVTFTSQVTLTSEALSGRYTKTTGR